MLVLERNGENALSQEVIVDAELVGGGEAALSLVVAVAEVVALAARHEGVAGLVTSIRILRYTRVGPIKTNRVVRGPRAVVRGPVQGGRIAVGATSLEGGQGNAKEELVRSRGLSRGQTGLPSSRGGHGSGEEESDDGGELHCDEG